MNILLTGGAGYIGSHTSVVLSQHGHEVYILDNFSNSHKNVIKHLNKILNKRLICVEGDIRDTQLVVRMLDECSIDAVIHFAGLKAVAESAQFPISYYANNIEGTISLLRAMKLSSVRKMVFSSSATVYGNPQYLPIDESHILNPTSPYGRSKLHVEQILLDLASTDAEWRIVCLRYFNPVGSHESGLLGEAPQGVPNNLMPFIADVAAEKYPYLAIYGDDYSTIDGTGVRDYVHIMDLADGHANALVYAENNPGLKIFNIGTGRGYSVLEMVAAYEKASGKKIPIQIEARRAGDSPVCFANPENAEKFLDWRARRTLEDMCKSSWQWRKYLIEST